jgi:hypothetical protein
MRMRNPSLNQGSRILAQFADDDGVPLGMQVDGPLPDQRDPHAIAATIVIVRCVGRLVHVADEVHTYLSASTRSAAVVFPAPSSVANWATLSMMQSFAGPAQGHPAEELERARTGDEPE